LVHYRIIKIGEAKETLRMMENGKDVSPDDISIEFRKPLGKQDYHLLSYIQCQMNEGQTL